MGNSASKTVPKTVKHSPPVKPANLEENSVFARQIMQNIKLKETPLISTHNQPSASNNLRKRMELDMQREGTISWHDFPSIFTYEQSKIDKIKVEEIKKYFSLPIKK